jgi:hypothetical protein
LRCGLRGCTEQSRLMKAFGRYTLVIVGSLVTGAALFVSSFVAMDFVWTHFVGPKPKDVGLGDGVMVVGGGFVIGCTLGVAGLAVVLYKFWPRRTQSKALPE